MLEYSPKKNRLNYSWLSFSFCSFHRPAPCFHFFLLLMFKFAFFFRLLHFFLHSQKICLIFECCQTNANNNLNWLSCYFFLFHRFAAVNFKYKLCMFFSRFKSMRLFSRCHFRQCYGSVMKEKNKKKERKKRFVWLKTWSINTAYQRKKIVRKYSMRRKWILNMNQTKSKIESIL